MAIRKLRKLDSTTLGISLPLDELRHDGLADEEGEPTGEEQRALISRRDSGEYVVEFVGKED